MLTRRHLVNVLVGAFLLVAGCANLPPPTLAQQVQAEIRTVQPYHSDVYVQVHGNTAYLYGYTESLYDSNLMTLVANRIAGIDRVVNRVHTTN